jgi:hypothetical protein
MLLTVYRLSRKFQLLVHLAYGLQFVIPVVIDTLPRCTEYLVSWSFRLAARVSRRHRSRDESGEKVSSIYTSTRFLVTIVPALNQVRTCKRSIPRPGGST